tara:strand:- start:55 stop:306 length:252 start_codon:yes stop_codon:yes gene_type:complete
MNDYIKTYHSSEFSEILTEVLNDTYWYENMGVFGTHYFWVKNTNDKAIFAKTLDEFNEIVYEKINKFLLNRDLKKLERKRGKK